MYVHIKCPTLSAGSSRERGLDTLDRTPPAKTDWVPCVFWGESKNGFVISDHADSSLPKNGRSEKESFTMTTACPSALREKKKKTKKNSNNKLILTKKTRRKSNISQEWIYEMHIFRFERQTFLEQNTPLRIVKLLEFKIEADVLFFF